MGPDRLWVFFARDLLPPVGAWLHGTFDMSSPQSRIAARLQRLNRSTEAEPPEGTVNPIGVLGRDGVLDLDVQITDDLATVEFGPAQFDRIQGSTPIILVLGQLVYTITEEPGIRRALLKERGKDALVIDGVTHITEPSTRDDWVSGGYGELGHERVVRGFGSTEGPTRTVTTSWSVEQVAPVLTRFIVATDLANVGPGVSEPDFEARMVRVDGLSAKWKLVIEVINVSDRTSPSEAVVEQTPLRVIAVRRGVGPTTVTTYELYLDDARPWRTALVFDPVRIVVDIGGHPSSVARNTAVYGPRPGDAVSSMFSVSGVASAFEAHVGWRVRAVDAGTIAEGGTTSTTCCQPGGIFETMASVPESFTGEALLEVFQSSGKDGSDIELVRVPIRIRPRGGVAPTAMPHALFRPAAPTIAERGALQRATYTLEGPFNYEARLTKWATLGLQQGIRTYQIDPQRDVWVIRVERPIDTPIRCGSFVRLIDAIDGYDRGTLCGDAAWPLFGS